MKIGIDIGGSHIGVGLVENGIIIAKKEKNIKQIDKQNMEEFLEQNIVELINIIINENNINISSIEKIGIATPGTVINNQIVANVVNLNINQINLYNILKKYFSDIPILIRNDAKCAGIAEKKYGNMKNFEDCLFICLGTGVGGAVFLNNKLLCSHTFNGFEIGHMTINKNGPICNCGKVGCFDIYGSMKNLKEKLIKELNLNNDAISTTIIPKIEENENEKIKNIIDEYETNVAIGISNLINIFEPEITVLGGSFAHYEKLLLNGIKNKILTCNMLLNKRNDINIVSAKLLNDAGIIGSVE